MNAESLHTQSSVDQEGSFDGEEQQVEHFQGDAEEQQGTNQLGARSEIVDKGEEEEVPVVDLSGEGQSQGSDEN